MTTAEAPRGVFYPSLVCNLRLMFDEALHTTATPPPAPVSTAERAAQRAACHGVEPLHDPLVVRPGAITFVMDRVPKKASVNLKGYREAATFDLTFDFRQLPIDPRAVRAASVEIHVGTVSAANFAHGMEQSFAGQRASVLDTRTATGGINADTLLFIGTVDEWENNDEEKSSTVRISGRDLRGILIDSPLSSQSLARLEIGRPIDDVIRQILCFHPLGEQFTVAVNPAEWADQTVPVLNSTAVSPRHRRGARGRTPRPANNAPATDMTFWDAITRYCFLVGAVPYFHGAELRVRPLRSVFDQIRAGFDPRIPTPFAGGRTRTVDGYEFAVRHLVYGRNVRSMKLARKMAGRNRPKVVRVVSVEHDAPSRDGTQAPILEARWPVRDTSRAGAQARSTRVAPSGQQTHEEVVTVPVPGVHDLARLTEIARALFEEMGRQEMTGAVRTRALASFGAGNEDPDLLRARPGDALVLQVDHRALQSRPPLVSALTDLNSMPSEQAVREIADRLGDENLARVIVATARGALVDLQRYFRLSAVGFDWSDRGLELDFELQNYFVHRYQTEQAASDPGTVQRRSS